MALGFCPSNSGRSNGKTHANWNLLASDDGSTDETIAILRPSRTSTLERFRWHMSAASQRAYDLFGGARKSV
jgi:hypothetical protein